MCTGQSKKTHYLWWAPPGHEHDGTGRRAGKGEDGAAVVTSRPICDEDGGGLTARVRMEGATGDEPALGPTTKDAVQPDGKVLPRAAAAIAVRSVEPRVQLGFHARMRAIVTNGYDSEEGLLGQAGQSTDRFRVPNVALAVHACSVRVQLEINPLGSG